MITHYIGDAVWSWVDAYDVAAVAAEALLDPGIYHEQIIPLGYDAKSMDVVAGILSQFRGRHITALADDPDNFYKAAVESGAGPAYMHCVYTQFKLDAAGEIPGAGTVFDNFEKKVDRVPVTWEAFAAREKDSI